MARVDKIVGDDCMDSMNKFDVLMLIARPAAGKSEIIDFSRIPRCVNGLPASISPAGRDRRLSHAVDLV